MKCRFQNFLFASLLAVGFSADAYASACRNPTYVTIRFAPGSYCWLYEGNATTFVGQFGGGQVVEVRMSSDRYPSVVGPNNFFASTDIGGPSNNLQFRTGRAGTYSFAFYPCVEWHSYGRVEICAY